VKTLSVEGPIAGGSGRVCLIGTSLDLAPRGYEQQEYFISGEARSFTAATPLRSDGRWGATPADTAPYTTRIVVHRPVDPAAASGVVLVEWLNVSAGFDTAADWIAAHNVMMRTGAIWMGVSAQAGGVHGDAPAIGGVASGGLVGADPDRYRRLAHPGDSFSYDIYSQAGLVARGGAAPDPTGGAKVKTVVAIGESQSAYRLVTYLNGVHPLAHAYDGFLVHSRGAGSAPLAQAPQRVLAPPNDVIVRADLAEPVLIFQTETDFTQLHYADARQPDTDLIRVWEVAGTAHADAYTAGIGFDDIGDGEAERKLLDVAAIDGGALGCVEPINAGPAYAVLQAALQGLMRWSAGRAAPPIAPRIEMEADSPRTIARDEHGNARGGIRTPLVEAPIASLRGDGNEDESFCRLFGTTYAFDGVKVAALYRDHDDYVTQFEAATAAAVRDGFLLAEEAENLVVAAQRSDVAR
jgi:hypothetical protein